MFYKSLLVGLLVGCCVLFTVFIGSIWYDRLNKIVQNPVIQASVENMIELTVIYKKEAVGGLQYGDDSFKISYQWSQCYIIEQIKHGDKSVQIKPFLPGGLDLLHPIFTDLVMPPNQAESLSTLSPDNWKMYSENNNDYISVKILVSNDAWQHFRQGLGL